MRFLPGLWSLRCFLCVPAVEIIAHGSTFVRGSDVLMDVARPR